MRMTLPMFRAYSRACARLERERLADLLLIVATGAQGGAEGIAKLTRELRKGL
jgi:hypothetical protein